jgi:upstream activation factor subunit UAF30
MAFDFGSLEPHIHQILSAPGTDLSTISAKRVRRQLVEFDPSLTPEFLKENKDDVDKVIASVFEKVSGGLGGETPSDGVESAADETKPRKRKQEDDEGAVNDDDAAEEHSPPTKKPKASKNGRELSDAELARKLSSEINSRSTRTGAKGRGGATAAKRGSRAKKSAATVDSDEDSDAGTTRSTRRKKSTPATSTTRTGAKGGFQKEFALRHVFLPINLGYQTLISYYSEPLAALLQVENLSRPQVVKQLWVYIKGNELQNPQNKREILCDVKLRAVFGVDKLDMFKMNKVLGQYVTPFCWGKQY